jgi:hypothetical protein
MTTTQINRARFLFENYTLNAASITVTPTPLAGYPSANLKDPDRTMLCKVSGVDFNAIINLPADADVNALALTGLGYSVYATFRLRWNSVNGGWGAPAYDSGVLPAYPSPFGFGAGNFGDYGFGGYITGDDAPFYRPSVVLFLPDTFTAGWWNLDITDATAAAIGIGVIGLTQVTQMKRNFSDSLEVSTTDTTNYLRSTMGALKAGRPGTQYDTFKLKFRNVPVEDKYYLHNAFKKLGDAGSFFAVLNPEDDGADSPWTTIYCVPGYAGFKPSGRDYFDFDLTLQEQPSPPLGV